MANKKKDLLAETPVLDKGYVRLIEVMGSDQRVIDAARVSTGSASDESRDKQLIFFLMENQHETPFEKIIFEFAVKCPIFVARQWFRHRIGSFNERSARYRAFEMDYYVPNLENLPDLYSAEDIEEYVDSLKAAYETYEKLLKKAAERPKARARAREVFRGLLGTSYYTEFFWTVNFRSLMNFIRLRMATDAQYEIRQYGEVINDMIAPRIPWSHEAFMKFAHQKRAGQEKQGQMLQDG